MARCQVEQVRCDRCKRVETVPVVENQIKSIALDVRMAGESVVKYDDLCDRCRAAIRNTLEGIKEWDREVKQQFGPTLGANEAAPLSVPPTYSPPQPHSAASKKR